MKEDKNETDIEVKTRNIKETGTKMRRQIDMKDKDESKEEIAYPYAQWILSEIKDQYAIENERESRIMIKAGAFITLIVAIITLYIPLIPFDSMKAFFANKEGSIAEMASVIIFLIILVLGVLCLLMAFRFLVKAYGVKGYNRVNVDDLMSIANTTDIFDNTKQSQYAQGIVAHYHEILRGTIDKEGNMKINSNSAEHLDTGIKWIIAGFILISIATIALRIVVVV